MLNLIQAADLAGIEIPHYCYHPGLTIAGNCRMCLVEIEKVPKLQIACNTRVTEGMVVRTQIERVKKAREAVLEFLLLNHPIDCPICDQAGECKLQDYYMDYDRQPSRIAAEEKVHKGKALDVGRIIMLDQERCILCTRCVRFLDEVTHTGELGVFQRGDHCEIDIFPDQRVDNAVLRQRRRHLPGRRPHQQGFSFQGARLVPRPHPVGVHRVRHRLQHRRSTTAAARSTASGRARTRRSTSTGCATRGG